MERQCFSIKSHSSSNSRRSFTPESPDYKEKKKSIPKKK